MRKGRLAPGFLGALALTLTLVGCSDSEPVGPARITRLETYRCAVPNAVECAARGTLVPSGELPPANEAFQLWVWHPGSNTTRWTLKSSLDNGSITKVGWDSAVSWFHLQGAAAKRYSVLVEILGPNNTIVSQDSVVWVFP